MKFERSIIYYTGRLKIEIREDGNVSLWKRKLFSKNTYILLANYMSPLRFAEK